MAKRDSAKIVFDKKFFTELDKLIKEEQNITWTEDVEECLKQIMTKTNSTLVALKMLQKMFPDKKFTINSVQKRKEKIRNEVV